jgi:hypothetical protein
MDHNLFNQWFSDLKCFMVGCFKWIACWKRANTIYSTFSCNTVQKVLTRTTHGLENFRFECLQLMRHQLVGQSVARYLHHDHSVVVKMAAPQLGDDNPIFFCIDSVLYPARPTIAYQTLFLVEF